MKIYHSIIEKTKGKKKLFSVLIDPDKLENNQIKGISKIAEEALVDFFFVGGSIITNNNLDKCVAAIKNNSSIPVILFPGSVTQISNKADAILFLSLISGRNPEMLIGKHVTAAPFLKVSKLEVISTGYMIIDGGKPTAVSYMSNSTPIPADKDEIAMCTAMAGEMLGMKLIYMDAGSGAKNSISSTMIKKVKGTISVPLIVGGGIKTAQQAKEICKAGADIVVVGNAFEKNHLLIKKISQAIHSVK